MDRSTLSAGFAVGDWEVDPRADRLYRGAESTKIDARSMEVLVYLASRAGKVVLQTELEEAVWKHVAVTSNATYQTIAQLRRALGEDRHSRRYIETIPRKGYRL